MDHPSRLELIHILYGLSASDGHVHPDEVHVIQTIANYLSTKSYQGILQYYGIGDRYEDIRQACLVDRDMDRASELSGTEVIDRIAITGPIDEVA